MLKAAVSTVFDFPCMLLVCYLHVLLMQAQKHNYTYPRYAWILYDWYADEWWTMGSPIACKNSTSDLMTFLDRAITVQLPEFGNETTDIGTVSIVYTILC